jgi:hypothetical protein
MKTVIEMARESWLDTYGLGKDHASFVEALERFAALVRADEREAAYKRRGVLMFNPYSGTPRHPSDIQSDPHAILLLDPDQALRALKPTGGVEP